MRDRVVLLGETAREPTDVDSLDELLFMVPRRLVQREPVSESPELAWHAYAVEYGLRARSLGLRVCAVDIPLTHNSLTMNLDRLDVANRRCCGIPSRCLARPRTGGHHRLTFRHGSRRRNPELTSVALSLAAGVGPRTFGAPREPSRLVRPERHPI